MGIDDSSAPTPDWVEWYLEGQSLRQVGRGIGISGQQVANRLAALGVPLRTKAAANELKRQRQLAEHGVEIERLFLRTRNIQRVSAETGVPVPAVRDYLESSIPDFKVLARSPRSSRKFFSSTEMLESLLEAASTLPGLVTYTAYREFVGQSPTWPDGRERPGEQGIVLRFGSWNAALDAAGLPLNPNPSEDFCRCHSCT